MSGKLLQNKVALITGGSRGIGKAVAAAYLREGAKVMLAARSKEELEATQAEFKKQYAGVEIFALDVSEPREADELIARTTSVLGKVDILVNAAGIYGPIGPSEQVSFADWKRTFEINVFGTFLMIQKIVPIMRESGRGKIINFSGGGDGPMPRFSAYNASKVSIVRLTETLAEEYKGDKVDVNAIAPGPVNTHFLDEALSAGEELTGEERYQALLKQKKEGGVPPEKTADICVFLASSQSDGLTGKFLSVVWDNWREWDREKITELMQSNFYTLRRVKPGGESTDK